MKAILITGGLFFGLMYCGFSQQFRIETNTPVLPLHLRGKEKVKVDGVIQRISGMNVVITNTMPRKYETPGGYHYATTGKGNRYPVPNPSVITVRTTLVTTTVIGHPQSVQMRPGDFFTSTNCYVIYDTPTMRSVQYVPYNNTVISRKVWK